MPSDRFARFADILHTEFYQVVQDEVKEIRTTADSQAHRIHDLEGELAKCKQSLREEKAKGEQWRRQYWSLKNNVDKLAACENGKMEGVQ